MINLKDLTPNQLKEFFQEINEKPFRANQVFQWIYRGAKTFDEMTDLSKPLREKLKVEASLTNLKILRVQTSKTDGTRKYLFGLGGADSDGTLGAEPDTTIESVFMKYKYGNSVCVSSQAGCRMGCRFCASGIGGLQRDLTPGEIVDQIISIERDTGEKVNHVVVMGTGEPLDNYENTKTFIYLINDKAGLNIGLRNITVSTCGLIPQIRQLAEDLPQINLAISLHSVDDKTRTSMMPVNKSYPVDKLLWACKEHTERTGRRITFEYALVSGVNDTREQIDLLAQKLKGMLCHVNLIPLNEVKETGMKGSNRKHAEQVAGYLEGKGISTTVRRELGADIDAACGQLRLGNV